MELTQPSILIFKINWREMRRRRRHFTFCRPPPGIPPDIMNSNSFHQRLRSSQRKSKPTEIYSDFTLLTKKRPASRRAPELTRGYYVVERLLAKRTTVDNGETSQYLVKWKGYSMEQCTWEPRYNLTQPEVWEMVQVFEASIKNDTSGKKRSAATTSSPGEKKASVRSSRSPVRDTKSGGKRNTESLQSRSGGKSKAKRMSKKPKTAVSEEVQLKDGSTGYKVEKLLRRRRRGGAYQYLVKWLGYPKSDCTWEPIEHLQQVMDLVRKCDKKVKCDEGHYSSEEEF